jgi:hypothetical protein
MRSFCEIILPRAMRIQPEWNTCVEQRKKDRKSLVWNNICEEKIDFKVVYACIT